MSSAGSSIIPILGLTLVQRRENKPSVKKGEKASFPSFLSFCLLPSASCFLALGAVAQPTPPGVNLPPNILEGIEEEIIPKQSPDFLPEESPAPPPEPSLQIPSLPQNPEVTIPSSVQFDVKTVEVLGSTVLQAEIAELTKKYKNREVRLEELFQLRSAITKLYIENGYITSGAFLLQQDSSNGVVQIQVVEGEIEDIELRGLNRLQEGYVRSRLELATDTPLHRNRLEEALKLLQLDPLLNQVDAELTAGSGSGSNILQVELEEAPAFNAGVSTANNQSPSIGSLQTSLFIGHDNLLGFGDRFSAQYSITEGLNLYDINYAIPVNPHNGTLSVSYNNGDSQITEEQFEEFEIESETRTFSVGFRQPIFRSPETEFALSLALDLRRSQTFLLGEPFSFSVGPENGESKVTVLRFAQDWFDRSSPSRILAARSQFSFGLGAFDATLNDTGTDGRFFSWLGQFQWVEQLSPKARLVTQLNAQLTPDSLLSLERFSMGGVDTVRGYRQNQLVADNGILGSVEVYIPLTSDPSRLKLAPFFEFGTAWNNLDPDPDPATIASLGLSLRWRIISGLDLRLDYGIPLIEVNNRGNSLQENGFHFSVRYQPW
ncbi:MAG: ShlB/FhaC/HecB family hemolysin secretion/activation protein [Symploca sp. SIO2G7]|nr:ShlB/FhaC/HecB family hemolysin secretion/activation protein [Symploca sp. SIO2G7]